MFSDATTPQPTITDLGFNKGLLRNGLLDNLQAPPAIINNFSDGVTGNMMGSQELGSGISFGYQEIFVNEGQDIQTAIDKLHNAGGGTLRLGASTYIVNSNLTIYSNITIIGVGLGITIIDFNATGSQIYCVAASILAPIKNVRFKDFTVQNSTADNGAFYFVFTQSFEMNNIEATDNKVGVKAFSLINGMVINCGFDNNTSHGWNMIGQLNFTGATTGGVMFLNTTFDDNGGDGYVDSDTPGNIDGNVFVGCEAFGNTGNGWNTTGAKMTFFYGCHADSNTVNGFNIGTAGNGIQLFSCTANENTVDGFNVTTSRVALINCRITSGNTVKQFDFSDIPAGDYKTCIMIGCATFAINSGGGYFWKDNLDINDAKVISMFNGDSASPRTTKNILLMLNNSGGQRVLGDVVVRDSTDTTGEKFTTTVTGGDKNVIGMVLSGNGTQNVANGAYGYVLVEGYTTKLKVDGTTDIAIGDMLTCFTTAGIAKKAAAGDTVFAIALEAYTANDSNGVIDATLISPRLI